MFLTFLIYYLVNFAGSLDFLKWLSPFKYFDASVLLASRQLDPVFVALSAAIIVLAIFGTYRFYSARDLTV
jgi:ABC-2 type transport system permease protein